MIKKLSLLVVLCGLLCVNPVYAESVSKSSLNNILINLKSWLDNRSIFENKEISLPKLKQASKQELYRIAYGKNPTYKNKIKILGLYNNQNETIYIYDQLDVYNSEVQAIILHELVHHYQFQTGYTSNVSDIRELESLCYFIEKKYLRERALLAAN